MNNSIFDIDYTRTLPDILKNDENILALGKIIAIELQKNISFSRLNNIYARIDELDEDLLDILSYDLHIDWYDCDSPIDVKRAIIKDSVKVHKYIGTKYAVEQVVNAYFGSGAVREWFDYEGEPYHFKIISDNPSLTNERIKQFYKILETVKRKSAWLDAILITLTGEMNVYTGVCVREAVKETHFLSSGEITLYNGIITHEANKETYFIYSNDLTFFCGLATREATKESYFINSSQGENQHD